MTWTSPSPGTYTTNNFSLAGTAATEGSLSVVGDDLEFVPGAVPEPSRWTLLLISAVFLAGMGWKRLRQAKESSVH
jgi:hypothetical protein